MSDAVESKPKPLMNSASFGTNKGGSMAFSRTNIDDITKILGFINEEYKCVHNNFSGILFAGPLALVFQGRIFFFEWTVVIKWEDVVRVLKQETGVRIEVSSPNKATYDFEQMFNPDKVYSSLVSLHNDTIIGAPSSKRTPRSISRGLRRGNSDPLQLSQIFNFDEPPVVYEGHVRDNYSSSIKKYSRTVSDPSLEPVQGQDEASNILTPTSLKNKWSEVIEDLVSYSETSIENQELPCDLKLFFAIFVADDAKYSVPAMMKESGDEDIQCSEWKAAEDGVSKCRNIEYTHPVNAPMAPPMARARKEQAYRQYGEHGLVLETKTFVSDVPMTDCFYVADIIRVEPIGDKVSISMHFDIRFVKSTMFKSIISRTTKSEFQNFMKRLANFMAKNLGEEAVIAPFRPQPAPTESPTPSNPYNSTIVPNLTIALLIFIMFLQSWVILDMRSMKREMHVFRETWARDCVAPDVTAEL